MQALCLAAVNAPCEVRGEKSRVTYLKQKTESCGDEAKLKCEAYPLVFH